MRIQSQRETFALRIEAMAAHDGVFWHGSPSGELVGSRNGLHVGTYEAARDALEARIGTPADGRPWDGTRAYGETPLNMDQVSHVFHPHGDRPGGTFTRKVNKQPPELPSGRAVYGDGTPIPLDAKPNLFPVRIVGPMSNTPETPRPDYKANGYMRAQITRGSAKRGYYYSNQGEGVTIDPLTGNVKYSISAVVPNGGTHLERLDRAQHPFPPSDPDRPNTGSGYGAGF